MNRSEAEKLLKERFKFDYFYDQQWETINKVLQGDRVLLIEKTGFGKSLCFQFPATIFEGMTVVFSPLIALMRDQVKKLKDLGITARCINCEQTHLENTNILEDAKQRGIKILYIVPERQESEQWLEAVRQMKLSMVVVDEAHCISVWGHDFRPTYRRIINLVRLMPQGTPILATTATATKRVEIDIAEQIAGNITILRGNLLRDNFRLFVIRVNSEDEKLIWLGQNLEKLSGSGILYTGTRVNTEIYARWLECLKIPVMAYNAGLDADSRVAIESGLMENRWKCVISTNALGMGIDKPDIRFIIHTQIPQSPIHYYQEIGRAGRDGKPAQIILFYALKDRELPEVFIEGGRPSIYKYEKVIRAIKTELLGEREILRRTNFKQTQIRVIKADLIEQGIAREVLNGKSKMLEYIPGAPLLNVQAFEQLRNAKKLELYQMIRYVETDQSRMKFLCEFLGDQSDHKYDNCDNTGLEKKTLIRSPEWMAKVKEFHENYFPELNLEQAGSKLVNGVAASHYGVSNVGSTLHRCKYEHGGDFPDFLVSLCLKAFRKKFGQEQFDLVVYIPPTVSGDLVKNFAEKMARILKFPISHELKKIRPTQEQKVFENFILKAENVKNVFTFIHPELVVGKKVLLIDDICDSGMTIKEIGRFLTRLGAIKILPVVIAKTIGGDLL
jgi:ATP-dependent DNA helicase RecQ